MRKYPDPSEKETGQGRLSVILTIGQGTGDDEDCQEVSGHH